MSYVNSTAMAGYERLVTSEPVEFSACGEPLRHGTLLLTDHRLVLDAGKGHVVEVPLAAVQRVSLSPFLRRLRLDIGEECITIVGDRVTRIHGALSALLHGPASGDELAAGSEELLDAMDAMLMRGPLAHPGELVVTTRRLHFRAHRRLDELAGARPMDLPLDGVREVSLRGWPERRLVVTTPTEELTFSVDHPVETIRRLVPLLVRAETFGLGPIPFGDLPAPDAGAAILEAWGPTIGARDGVKPLLAAPAARWTREHVATRGWLLITERHVLFLPLGGPRDGAEPFVAALGDVGASVGDDASQLVVAAGETQLRVNPLGGARTVRRLMPRLTLSAVLPEPSQQEGAVRQLVGELSSVRLLVGETELLSRSGEQLVELDGAIGLVLSITPDLAFEVGAAVTLEAGKNEGVYRLQGRIRGLHRAAEVTDAPTAAGVVLALELVGEITFTNRRGHFRAPAQLAATVRRLVFAEGRGYEAVGETTAVGVADLSTGGCRLLLPGELAVGDETRLSVELAGAVTEVDCRVVRTLGVQPQEGQHMYGVRFFNVTQPIHDRVQREVFRLQRELLLRRADSRTVAPPDATA